MDFGFSPRTQELQAAVRAFMAEHVYPNEARFWTELEANTRAGRRWTPLTLIEELKPKARAAGLWNLFLPESELGAGLLVNAPMQHGLASFLADPVHYEGLAGFYESKRDRFRSGLDGSRFRLLPCEGTYFQCVEYDNISNSPDTEFCRWLTETVGVAAIPLSAFFSEPPQRQRVRFCFAKRDETLDEALKRLQSA